MSKDKVIKLRIYPTEEEQQVFADSSRAFTDACNYISQRAFEDFDFNNFSLHHKYYYEIRKLFGLKSQLAISVIKAVAAKYKAVKKQLSKNPFVYEDEAGQHYISKDLSWLTKPICFKQPVLILQRGRDWSFTKDNQLSLNSNSNKRVKTSFTTKGFDKYFSDEWSFGAGQIIKRNNKWYFYLSVNAKSNDPDVFDNVVGVDRGIVNIISTFDNSGNKELYSGAVFNKKRNRILRTRASLQRKGTKGAKRVLKRLSERENRYINDVNHCLSKALAQKYGPNTLFVLENLSDIRKQSDKFNKKRNSDLNSWPFYQLESLLSYKALDCGSMVIKVSADYTSQRCPACGTIDKDNRHRDIHLYQCCNCGFEENDDITAAMNLYQLGLKYIAGTSEPKFVK